MWAPKREPFRNLDQQYYDNLQNVFKGGLGGLRPRNKIDIPRLISPRPSFNTRIVVGGRGILEKYPRDNKFSIKLFCWLGSSDKTPSSSWWSDSSERKSPSLFWWSGSCDRSSSILSISPNSIWRLRIDDWGSILGLTPTKVNVEMTCDVTGSNWTTWLKDSNVHVLQQWKQWRPCFQILDIQLLHNLKIWTSMMFY